MCGVVYKKSFECQLCCEEPGPALLDGTTQCWLFWLLLRLY